MSLCFGCFGTRSGLNSFHLDGDGCRMHQHFTTMTCVDCKKLNTVCDCARESSQIASMMAAFVGDFFADIEDSRKFFGIQDIPYDTLEWNGKILDVPKFVGLAGPWIGMRVPMGFFICSTRQLPPLADTTGVMSLFTELPEALRWIYETSQKDTKKRVSIQAPEPAPAKPPARDTTTRAHTTMPAAPQLLSVPQVFGAPQTPSAPLNLNPFNNPFVEPYNPAYVAPNPQMQWPAPMYPPPAQMPAGSGVSVEQMQQQLNNMWANQGLNNPNAAAPYGQVDLDHIFQFGVNPPPPSAAPVPNPNVINLQQIRSAVGQVPPPSAAATLNTMFATSPGAPLVPNPPVAVGMFAICLWLRL